MKTRLSFGPNLAMSLTLLLAGVILWGTLSAPGGGTSPLPFTDKQLHAMAFAALIFPLALSNPRRAVAFLPAYIAFGAMIELVQPLVGRSGEWADLAADGAGAGVGLLLGASIFQARARLKTGKPRQSP